MRGRGGADLIVGHEGDDTLVGDHPNAGDLVSRDRVFGGRGADRVIGGDGFDRLHGGADADRINGNGGRDLISGGSSNDVSRGNRGNDRIFANRGVDESFGGGGNDELSALARADVSGPGDVIADTLHGEEGDDDLRTRDGEADKVDCGAGNDIARLDQVDVITDATAGNPNGSCERVVRADPKPREDATENGTENPAEDSAQS